MSKDNQNKWNDNVPPPCPDCHSSERKVDAGETDSSISEALIEGVQPLAIDFGSNVQSDGNSYQGEQQAISVQEIEEHWPAKFLLSGYVLPVKV